MGKIKRVHKSAAKAAIIEILQANTLPSIKRRQRRRKRQHRLVKRTCHGEALKAINNALRLASYYTPTSCVTSPNSNIIMCRLRSIKIIYTAINNFESEPGFVIQIIRVYSLLNHFKLPSADEKTKQKTQKGDWNERRNRY